MNKEELEKLREQLLEQVEKLPEKQASMLREQIKNASAEQLEAFIKAQQSPDQQGGECFFCQFISGKIETVKIYEDADILAILDIYPSNPGHMIVMPKKHFEFIYEIPDSILNKIFLFVKTLEPIILETTKAQAISIYIAQGAIAGQTVRHFSVNIIPRFENDDISFEWQKKKQNKKEIEKIATKIKKKAEKVVIENFEKEKKKEEKKKKKQEESEAQKMIKHIKKRIP